MHNLVLSPIDPEKLISSISERVTANILKALSSEQQPEADDLLTVQAAAKFLSLSVPTIYGLIHRGEIPVMKRSKRCYFSKLELISYLKEGRKMTVAENACEISISTDAFLSNLKKRRG